MENVNVVSDGKFVQEYVADSATQNAVDRYEDNFYPADGIANEMTDIQHSELFGIKSKKEGGPGLAKGLYDKYQSSKPGRKEKRGENSALRKNKRTARKSERVLRAEEKARVKALAAGATQEEADIIANKAGAEEMMNEQSGYIPPQGETPKKPVEDPRFWKDMPTIGKVLIIAGGVTAVGLLIWGIASKVKK